MKKKRMNHRQYNKQIQLIEHHLRHYNHYQVGVKNLRKQLDFILPNTTASYELSEGSKGCFVVSSTTEKAALDRIESKKALDINEKISEYQLIISSIDDAIKNLEENQRKVIQLRYIDAKSIDDVAKAMGYTHKNIYKIRHHAMEKLMISLWNILSM